MVGSQFVLIKRNGRQTLLNIRQIASLWVEDIDMSDETNRIGYRDIDPAIGTLYAIELLMTSRREAHFYFSNATDRDAVYEQLLAAISPALAIESNGPATPKLPGQKWSRFPKPNFPNKVFATEAEYDLAVSRVVADLMEPPLMRTQAPSSSTTPPTPTKHPRKPYTRKPRE